MGSIIVFIVCLSLSFFSSLSIAEEAPEETSSEEKSLVEIWDKGITPLAPQKYDGRGGVPQRPFASEIKSDGSPSLLQAQKKLLKKRKGKRLTRKKFKSFPKKSKSPLKRRLAKKKSIKKSSKMASRKKTKGSILRSQKKSTRKPASTGRKKKTTRKQKL